MHKKVARILSYVWKAPLVLLVLVLLIPVFASLGIAITALTIPSLYIMLIGFMAYGVNWLLIKLKVLSWKKCAFCGNRIDPSDYFGENGKHYHNDCAMEVRETNKD